MHVIINVSTTKFALNGILYLKNYITAVKGNKVTLFNCYESGNVLVELAHYNQFTVNGEMFTSATALQEALLDVIYYRNTLEGPGPQTGSLLELNDTPDSYIGKKGSLVRVKPNENGVEFSEYGPFHTQYYSLGNLPGMGDITRDQVSEWLNQQLFALSIGEASVPVLLEFSRILNGVTKKYIFHFTKGKGMWGAAGGANTAGTVYPGYFILTSILVFTPDDIVNSPASQIIPLGNLPSANYLNAANSQQRDFSDSGSATENGIVAYYFSYTQNGILYFVQFTGTAGIYGGSATPFNASQLVPSTNSNIEPTPVPGWQQTLQQNNVTSIAPQIIDPATGNVLTFAGSGMKVLFTNSKTLYLDLEQVENNFTLRFPAPTQDDQLVYKSHFIGTDKIVSTYAEMITMGAPVNGIYKYTVLNDENKGQTYTQYNWYSTGIRVWIAAMVE